MNSNTKLYSTYVSSHTSHLYGEITLDDIKGQFPVWKRYFGKFLSDDKSAEILDVGCGNGGFIFFLKEYGYENSSGIDISKEQVELAEKLGISGVKHADAISFIRDENKEKDVIFARDVIEHFSKETIPELLTLIFNSLKPGGVLIIKTPNAGGPFGSRYRYYDFTHNIAFTRESLNQVLRAAGFKEISFYPAGPVPKGIKSTARFILWKMIEAILRFYMLVEVGASEGIFTQNIIAVARKQG